MITDSEEVTSVDVKVEAYAQKYGISERQLIKLITTGKISGYQMRGIWYIRNSVPEQAKVAIYTIRDYAQRTGIPIPQLLEDIANGSRVGFHKQGIWYINEILSPQSPTLAVGHNKSISKHKIYPLVPIMWGLMVILGIFLMWKWYATISMPKTAQIYIEVQITDSMERAHPVTRKSFFLLSRSLDDIANNVPVEIGFPNTSNLSRHDAHWPTLLSSATALRSLLFDLSSYANRPNIWEFRQNFERSKLLWMPYVVQTAVTDYRGQAVFDRVLRREYWVVGWTETSTGLSFWQHKITVRTGELKIPLNPANAYYFR